MGDELYNQAFSMDEFNHALGATNNSAPGPDEITYEMIRQLPQSSKATLDLSGKIENSLMVGRRQQ